MRLWRRSAGRGPVKRRPTGPVPDERIFGRHYRGPSPAKIGLVVALVGAVGIYLAFAKHIPFTGHGYELHATFENAATLKPNSPVRIAGVNVGKVESLTSKGNVAEATFTVSDQGLPIHDDATVTIRPRLFLEGNFFLDLRPGSPSAAELSSGSTIPATQTQTAVQLDQILTALQSNDRGNLVQLLEGFGTALTHVPSAAEDITQDPDVQGESAAQAINQSFRYGGQAGRDTAITNEALLGQHPHDLSNLIRAQRDVFAKLASDEESLKGLITNFNVTAGALAAESSNLSASVRELAPTLEEAEPSLRHLSEALPPLRALAIELRPGIRELPATIRAADPWLVQTRKLLHTRELGGLAKLLAGAAPGLARTTHASLGLFPQLRLLGLCTSDVLVPSGDTVVGDGFSTGQPNFRELFYAAVNLSGESQGFDGNGQYVRFQSGGGPVLVKAQNTPGSTLFNFGNAIEAPVGVQPALPANPPPFRMDVPCHTNPLPDVNGPAGAAGPPDLVAVP